MNTNRLYFLSGLTLFCLGSSFIINPSPTPLWINSASHHSMVAGNPITLLPQIIPFPTTGTASIDVNRTIDAQLANLVEGITPDLGLLKDSSTEPRFVAIGGSLTAGVRNGGLYRQAQLTAYPSFMARQMGLTDFRQPLFNQSQGNGSGYKRLVADGDKIRYHNVTNALAVTKQSPLTFVPFLGRVDNLGMPGLGILGVTLDEKWRVDDQLAFSLPYEPAYRSYFRRLLPDDNRQWLTTYLSYATEQKSALCTIELGLDDALWFTTQGGYRLGALLGNMGLYETNPFKFLLPQLSKAGTKTVVATVPDVLDWPYFKQYTVASLRSMKAGAKLYVTRDDRYDYLIRDPMFVGQLRDDDILLPTANVVALFNGTSVVGSTPDNPLTSQDILNEEEQQSLFRVDALNTIITSEAKRYNIPVFDLKALYKKILAGQYTTDDGVKINPSFPSGNFFSADGLMPSALGQAVLANEWIKVINETYRTRIPLIHTNRITADF